MKSLFPLVKVKASDGLVLHGLLLEPEKKEKKTIKIHVHGDAGNFFYNSFYHYLAKDCLRQHSAFLATNNRGASVFENSVHDKIPHGVAAELFKDCVKDIDAWIAFALERSYEKVIF